MVIQRELKIWQYVRVETKILHGLKTYHVLEEERNISHSKFVCINIICVLKFIYSHFITIFNGQQVWQLYWFKLIEYNVHETLFWWGKDTNVLSDIYIESWTKKNISVECSRCSYLHIFKNQVSELIACYVWFIINSDLVYISWDHSCHLEWIVFAMRT